MSNKDYYQILGVSKDADEQAIKRAYRKLARKYHPDVSKEANAEQRFKEVGEAYEVLSNSQKRAAYDQYGSQWKAASGGGAHGGWQNSSGFNGSNPFGGQGDFGDFFENIFGQRSGGFSGFNQQGGAFRQSGEDVNARITIDVADSYSGAQRPISFRSPNGESRSLNVRIPKGIKPGQKIRLSGQGGAGSNGGAAGDLYLEVRFDPNSPYQIDGSDVSYQLSVAPWDAALGAKVSVPLPDGKMIDMKIPANSSGGRKLRLKGRGLPGKVPGDLYIELQIELPKADNDQARQAYQAFKNAFHLK
ncbi:DnaJ C-terminal domain-containing protein [Celerinatantimonas sp. YJH-8]|uniref:DnaJ C-terminal domain-containing protein n=1 Tax=Celerinatantimonas sp. YJH-8 TaxID=3228714 RepID=UPI0038C254AF